MRTLQNYYISGHLRCRLYCILSKYMFSLCSIQSRYDISSPFSQFPIFPDFFSLRTFLSRQFQATRYLLAQINNVNQEMIECVQQFQLQIERRQHVRNNFNKECRFGSDWMYAIMSVRKGEDVCNNVDWEAIGCIQKCRLGSDRMYTIMSIGK